MSFRLIFRLRSSQECLSSIGQLRLMGTLTHLRDSSQASPVMVDVSRSSSTSRRAEAEAFVAVPSAAWATLDLADSAKQALFTTASIAGIMAAKRTSSLIPMCHPIPVSHCDVKITEVEGARSISNTTGTPAKLLRVLCTAATLAPTGVEMEAMTGASVASLTLYDMLKSASKGIEVQSVRLLRKSGGKSGLWTAAGATDVSAPGDAQGQ